MAEKKDKPLTGDITAYTKELSYNVVNEQGEEIPCKDQHEAIVLSLLLEIKELLKKSRITSEESRGVDDGKNLL